MTEEGPPLELMLRRLAETPLDFLAEPAPAQTPTPASGQAPGQAVGIHTLAVVNDLLRLHGATAVAAGLAAHGAKDGPHSTNRLRLLSLLAWLLADDWFLTGRRDPAGILAAMAAAAAELAPLVPARAAVRDPERREELARLTLSHLSLRPAGETETSARDRLTMLSTAERTRVLAASRQAEERARAIREALAKKKAEESADKWSRE